MITSLKGAITVLVLFLFGNFYLVKAADLKLPLEGGYSYKLTVGYNGKSIFTNEDGTPYVDEWHQGDHYYALDFDNPYNYPNPKVVAVDNGEVITAKFTAGSGGYDSKGYGNYIKVKHSNGDISVYAHLSQVNVKEGQGVFRGQIIGIMGTTGNSSGTHLHFELEDSNGKSKLPEPMSGYTDFAAGQIYTSDNYFISFNFNDGTSQGWSAGLDTQYTQTSPDAWIVQVVDTDKDGVINPGVLSPIFGGVTTDSFSKLQFIAKISSQLSGVKQGDIWIKTPDGDWNHHFIFTHISDAGNGFHIYQSSFLEGLVISQFSIELTENNTDEKWEFDEIKLMGRPSAPMNLQIQ